MILDRDRSAGDLPLKFSLLLLPFFPYLPFFSRATFAGLNALSLCPRHGNQLSPINVDRVSSQLSGTGRLLIGPLPTGNKFGFRVIVSRVECHSLRRIPRKVQTTRCSRNKPNGKRYCTSLSRIRLFITSIRRANKSHTLVLVQE